MVSRSKLKLALSAEKGVDWKKVKEKRRQKETQKRKRKAAPGSTAAAGDEPAQDEDSDWEDVEDPSSGVGTEKLITGAPTSNGAAHKEDPFDDEDEDEEGGESGDEDAEAAVLIDVNESDSSESDIEMEEAKPRVAKSKQTQQSQKRVGKDKGQEDGDEEEEEEDDDDEDIPMSDLEDLPDEEKEDLIRHTRLTINNTAALETALNRIRIPTDASAPFATQMSVTSSKATADSIPDISDDLQRELALYAQSLEAAKEARQRLKKEGVPFSRPNDYFAEMVKDDGHMEKVKAKLVEEATAKKAAAEARKLRDLKKFGKQVQVAKLQERQKAKRETLDKIKLLKRKRQESSDNLPTTEADLFDVAVDNELQSHAASKRGASSARGGARGGRGGGPPNAKRQKKDERYGFGGKKRFAKSGDAVSTGDLAGFSVRRMKGDSGGGRGGRGGSAARGRGRGGGGAGRGGASARGKRQRPGKSRRKAMAAGG